MMRMDLVLKERLIAAIKNKFSYKYLHYVGPSFKVFGATLLKTALKEQRGGSWELFKKIKSTNGLPDTPAT